MITASMRGRPATRRRQVLHYASGYVAEHGRAPTYADICTALGIATRQEVSRIVAQLEQQGRLRRIGRGRGIRRISMA